MPEINFDNVDDRQGFDPLPEGSYTAKLTQIEEKRTRSDDEMWALTWTVHDEGEFYGRLIFDNLVFSQRALPRVKLICSRLGVDTSGTVSLTPDMLLDKRARVLVTIEEYSAGDGQIRKRNSVPFAGYEALPAQTENLQKDVPF